MTSRLPERRRDVMGGATRREGDPVLTLAHYGRRRPEELLCPAAGHGRAPLRRPRHPPALEGYARTARRRHRLRDAVPRPLPRGGGTLPRLHASGARGSEVAVGASE